MGRGKKKDEIVTAGSSLSSHLGFLLRSRLKQKLSFTLLIVLAVGIGGILFVSNWSFLPTFAFSSDYTLTEITPFLTNSGRVDWSSPQGEWLAYDYLETDGYWDVYRIRPDGTDNECLTCDRKGLPNRNQGNPAYHPGGRYLLFQAEKKRHNFAWPGDTQPGSGVYNDLWVLDFQTDKFYKLTGVRSRYPAGGSLHAHFSHDGSKLLWGDLESAYTCYGDWRLAVADFVTEPQPHLENIQYYQPGDQTEWYEAEDWSLDDSTIYFSCAPLAGQDDRTMDFCAFDLTTQTLTRLTETSGLNGEAAEWEEHGKVSPLGDALTWFSSQGYGISTDNCNYYDWLRTELWIANPDGSEKIQLTHFNDPNYPEYDDRGVIVSDHSWHPDGTKLAVLLYYNATQEYEIKIFHFAHQGSPTPTPTPTPVPTPTPTITPTPTPSPPSNTGWLSPTMNLADTGGDNDGFELNPTFAYTDASGYASNINGPGDSHQYLSYPIPIPSGANIEGLEVRLDWWLDRKSGRNSIEVVLSWDGGRSWTNSKSDNQETTSEHTVVLGGPSDTWGRVWTTDELTSNNFRVRVTSNSNRNGRDFFLDWLPIKIYYR